MNIITNDVSLCMVAVRDLLKDSQDVQDIGARVELAEPVNEDPTRCPWVGVYPLRTPFPTRAMPYRAQNNEFVVLCQQTHANDGSECLTALGKLVKAVCDALLTDTSLKATVQMLGDFEVEFLGVLKTSDAIMQTASIRAVGLTTVSGG